MMHGKAAGKPVAAEETPEKTTVMIPSNRKDETPSRKQEDVTSPVVRPVPRRGPPSQPALAQDEEQAAPTEQSSSPRPSPSPSASSSPSPSQSPPAKALDAERPKRSPSSDVKREDPKLLGASWKVLHYTRAHSMNTSLIVNRELFVSENDEIQILY